MSHLTYVEAIVTGLVQGVTELFPISSLGHNVLLPALIGGQWAKDLSVSTPGSPYLAFIVGLHVATAAAMILFFWRDWVRIIRGFFSSVRNRQIATPDQRLAWLIILGTIPVGIVGVALQSVFTTVFAKGDITAVFLAINGVILLYSERVRRTRGAIASAGAAAMAGGAPPSRGAAPGRHAGRGPDRNAPGYPGHGGYDPGRGGYGDDGRGGYGGNSQEPPYWQQQPGQQQWQGPDPRYDGPRYGRDENAQGPRRTPSSPRDQTQQFGQQPGGGAPWDRAQDPRYAQGGAAGRPTFTPSPQADPAQQYGRGPQFDQTRQYNDPRYGGPQGGQVPQGGRPRDVQGPWQPGGQPGQRRPEPWQPRQAAGARRPGFHEQPETSEAVAADRRLAAMSYKRGVGIGAFQIGALLAGISRDGIVTVAGMLFGLRRQDAVRYSFLLSAPVILAAGVLKVHDLFGPEGKGIHGPVLAGSVLAFIAAYFSIRFLTRYFRDDKSLTPFGIYCIVAGILSFAYLVVIK